MEFKIALTICITAVTIVAIITNCIIRCEEAGSKKIQIRELPHGWQPRIIETNKLFGGDLINGSGQLPPVGGSVLEKEENKIPPANPRKIKKKKHKKKVKR